MLKGNLQKKGSLPLFMVGSHDFPWSLVKKGRKRVKKTYGQPDDKQCVFTGAVESDFKKSNKSRILKSF